MLYRLPSYSDWPNKLFRAQQGMEEMMKFLDMTSDEFQQHTLFTISFKRMAEVHNFPELVVSLYSDLAVSNSESIIVVCWSQCERGYR